MLIRGFRGGAHPPERKTLTSDKQIKRLPAPKKVIIPLIQHTGAICKPVVTAGDMVKAGDLIGKADAFITAPVHASISGKVSKIGEFPHPVLGKVSSVVIEGGDAVSGEGNGGFSKSPRDAGAFKKEELIEIIKNAGIVGMGGAAFPACVKLSPPKNKTIDTVILNSAECEPYLTCDYRMMMEHPGEVLKGLEIIIKILSPKEAYIAFEDNKLSAAAVMEKTLSAVGSRLSGAQVRIAVLRTKYPQGAEKQLIKSVVNRVVPAGKLPLEVGCVVQNAGTAFAIYEAVYFGKPLIERCLTVTGSCVKEPGNLLVKIGTPLKCLVDACGGFTGEPKKVIFGGPMMGIAQFSTDVPVIKGTSGILFLSSKEVNVCKETACIRCGKCVESCPLGLVPTTLMNLVKKEYFKAAVDLGVGNCIECGACAYECPAKIPLVDYMKLGKAKLPLYKT
ncbi:electron transport complex subunit RsxC [Candidatus Omnitrophota bacterium]